MLGSAVCSQISTEELSFAANFIQSRNFRAFETYLLTTALYPVSYTHLDVYKRQPDERVPRPQAPGRDAYERRP